MIWIDSRWRCVPYQIELIFCLNLPVEEQDSILDSTGVGSTWAVL